jgi:hypothetical protein
MRSAKYDAQKVAAGEDSSCPRLDTTNPLHWEEGISHTMAHPECTRRNGSYDIIDVTYLQKMGKVRREIVRDPALLHGSERAEATGCEGYPHPFVVEGVPQCGLAAERMADYPQAPGIHAVVAPEHIQCLEHVEEVLGCQARAVQQTVCEEERFLLAALRGCIPPRERRPRVALFKTEMIRAKNDVAPSAKFNPIVVHLLAREARRL